MLLQVTLYWLRHRKASLKFHTTFVRPLTVMTRKKLAPKVVNIGSRYLTMMMFCGKNPISYLISKGKSKFLDLTYKIYDCSMLHYSCLSYPTPTTKRRCQHHMTDVPPLTATDRFCSFLMQRLLQSCSVGLHGPVLDRSPRRERRPWLLARG